jgi:tetratricopeptide (TPR) repeat protein
MALAGCAGETPRPAPVPPPPAPAAAPAAAEPLPTEMPQLLRAIEAAYRKGDYDRGLALVKRTLELQKSDVSTYDRLGSVYYVLGRSGEALTFWSKALPLERDAARRRRLEQSIALARRNLGLPDEPAAARPKPARPAPKPARADPEGSARQYKEGLRFYAEGSYLQATAAFLRALELDPSNEEARKALERLKLQDRAGAP